MIKNLKLKIKKKKIQIKKWSKYKIIMNNKNKSNF